jgi:hypothetical protein
MCGRCLRGIVADQSAGNPKRIICLENNTQALEQCRDELWLCPVSPGARDRVQQHFPTSSHAHSPESDRPVQAAAGRGLALRGGGVRMRPSAGWRKGNYEIKDQMDTGRGSCGNGGGGRLLDVLAGLRPVGDAAAEAGGACRHELSGPCWLRAGGGFPITSSWGVAIHGSLG